MGPAVLAAASVCPVSMHKQSQLVSCNPSTVVRVVVGFCANIRVYNTVLLYTMAQFRDIHAHYNTIECTTLLYNTLWHSLETSINIIANKYCNGGHYTAVLYNMV